MNLLTARVTGYFSLPSPALAEHNPTAYTNAMAAAPEGAGTCQHCGMGIRHHVIVALADGTTGFIGSQCAERVGCERVRYCVRDGITDEQLAAREAKAAKASEAHHAAQLEVSARVARREVIFKFVLDALMAQQTDFHASLASQLRYGPLSPRQANFACKAIWGRRNKSNGKDWDKWGDGMCEIV